MLISLKRLKMKALNADLNVLTLVLQKLMRKYEVTPINSQPKTSKTKLLTNNKKTILYKKLSSSNKNFSRKISSRI